MRCLGATKMLRERLAPLIYLAWDAGGTPHVSRSCLLWDVGDIQHTQEHFFFQGFSCDAPPSQGCAPVTSEYEAIARIARPAAVGSVDAAPGFVRAIASGSGA
jgi:hypothetical protein